MEFYQCKKCHALHMVAGSTENYPYSGCKSCGFVDVEKISGKYLISCPKCFEYWPKRVLKLIHKEGLLQCPSLTCDGVLKLRIHKGSSQVKSISESKPKVISKSATESVPRHNPPIPSEDIVVRLVTDGLVGETELSNISIESSKPVPAPLPVAKPISDISSKPEPLGSNESRPKLDFNLDFSQLKSHVNASQAKTILTRFQEQEHDLFSSFLSKDYYQGVFTSKLVGQYEKVSLYIREPIQNTFYVGELRGNYKLLKNLINFFVPLINTYPSIKVVFLGNYFGKSEEDKNNQIAAFLSICLFSMVYPENVVLLRGKDDYVETLDSINLYGMIATHVSKEKIPRSIIFTLIMNILKHLPVFHIGTMNQGQLSIYSSNVGIPLNKEDLSPLKLSIFSKWNFLEHASFSFQKINPYLSPIFKPIHELEGDTLKKFFSENALHYMVHSGDVVEKKDIDLTLTSCGTSPKIGRLQPGSTPELLDIDEETLKNALEETFGIIL